MPKDFACLPIRRLPASPDLLLVSDGILGNLLRMSDDIERIVERFVDFHSIAE